MRAIDVMVRDVVTVHPDTDIAEAVKLLAEHDVSALPVVDGEGNLLGILSEADLMRRVEIGTEKRRPWWQEAVTGAGTLAEEFAKSHGKKVGEIMTSEVVAVSEETPLFRDSHAVRAKAHQACTGHQGRQACRRGQPIEFDPGARLGGRAYGRTRRNRSPDPARPAVPAKGSILDRFWQPQHYRQRSRRASVGSGRVGSETERKALLALAEGVPGVSRVSDEKIAA